MPPDAVQRIGYLRLSFCFAGRFSAHNSTLRAHEARVHESGPDAYPAKSNSLADVGTEREPFNAASRPGEGPSRAGSTARVTMFCLDKRGGDPPSVPESNSRRVLNFLSARTRRSFECRPTGRLSRAGNSETQCCCDGRTANFPECSIGAVTGKHEVWGKSTGSGYQEVCV